MRIGILGGTFNPPHLGHLVCAQEAYVQLRLDRVMLIPARIPPHKPVHDEPGPEHRLGLCRLAVQGDEQRMQVSDVEIARSGLSYTVDTLEVLHSQMPESELFLILGADAAAGLSSWHQAERVLSLATLAVARRRGTTRAEVEHGLRRLRGADRAWFFAMPTIGVSSTIVRRRVRAGHPIKYLVPDAVAGYIHEHRLYNGDLSHDL